MEKLIAALRSVVFKTRLMKGKGIVRPRLFFLCWTFFWMFLALGSSADILLTSLPAYIGSGTGGGVAEQWLHLQPGVRWQWQLSGTLDTSLDVDLYDLDLFETPKDVIAGLKGKGKAVICYVSTGSWEEYREDAGDFPQKVLGKTLDGWPDEKWLDIRRIDLLAPIMKARMDLAVTKGCDGIEPDNIDGYTNDTGFALSGEDQLRYNTWLAEEAHKRGLSIGLKNDLDQVQELVQHFDWALNEQCFQYGECDKLLPFIEDGKAVLGVEYSLLTSQFCPQANAMNFDWLKKKLSLDSYRVPCR